MPWRGDLDGGSLDQHLAAVRLHHPGQDIHQGRLAGAVLADQRMHLARREIEEDVVESDGRTETLRYAPRGEEGGHQVPVRRSAGMSATAISVTPAE
jgi:hypothetical protein